MVLQSFIPKSRLEAFSDSVIAIIITIMVLELKAPHSTELTALKPVLPAFLTYALSFIYISIFWNNHHHLLHAAKGSSGKIMWANLHFLFWLSLIPFVTAWLGENHTAAWPTALYGFVLLMAGMAYLILQYFIVSVDPLLAEAFGFDWKGKLSLTSYALAIVLGFFNLWWLSDMFFVSVALMWFIPDRRIERVVQQCHAGEQK